MRASKEFADRLVVITGAASGIGRATALAFARASAQLFVCDLPGSDLIGLEQQLLAEGAQSVQTAAVDVGSREQMANFCELVCRSGTPDVLVNNAGVGLAGGLLATNLEDWHWIMNVNLWGVVHGCHFFAPKMAARGRGQIINIASAAGYYNSEAMTAYGTTKFAVIGLSEGLRAELAPLGVGVSVLCPGFIDTPIIAHMRMRGAAYPESERANVQRFYQKRNYGPERVAAQVLRAVGRNPALLPITPEAWALYAMNRIAPDLGRRLLRGLQRLAERRRSSRP
ncbi:MAG TPA: SDR family NAD(P)-dependent oxidoreductase [Polyangiaceae bacterium]|nr:SDR family NAD(P)-dependent oxidoreductase [Polyangiaceae bacterium]